MRLRPAGLTLALLFLTSTLCAAQDQYFDAGGLRLRFIDQGTGEPVVLVHGFSNRLELWQSTGIAQDLARDHRVIAFDLRGHGKSDKPHDPSRYGREMTLDIVRLLDHLHIARAHIVGYSLGGILTSQLLTLEPQRVLSATIIAGAGRFDWDSARARQADTVAAELERDCISRSLVLRLAPPTALPPEDTLRAMSARCLADSTQDRFALAAMTRSWAGQAITAAAVAAVTVPTLGLVGTDDPQRRGMEALAALRPGVKLVVVDGATHGGPRGILRRPELLAALREFLAGPPYPPPGRLVDIGGRKLHLQCSGHGTPTVVLVAGGGAFAIDWALVQPKVAATTRVCSYDRAGLGWSDPGPAEETVEETVDDLHRLLRAAGEREPYLLVGASIGGIFIRAYQHTFPNEVAGLVFDNSAHRVGMQVKGGKGGLLWDLSEDELRSAYPLPASSKGPAPTREGEPFDRLPPDLQAMRLWLDGRLWEKWDPAKAGPESVLSWRKEFLREFDEMAAGPNPPLGDLPVIVLSSDERPGDPNRRRDRTNAGVALDLLSSNALYITATGSGHEIHLYQPDQVVGAIGRAVGAVRNRVPLVNR